MTFYGQFADVKDKKYYIEINTPSGSQEIDFQCGNTPAVMTVSSGQIFSPIKSRSLTVEMFTLQYYFDLYEPSARGTTVKLYDEDNRVYFRGFLTPLSFDQNWTYADTIELEAVDGISTAKDFKWTDNGQYNSFLDILISILGPCNYRGVLYIPDTYKADSGQINGRLCEYLRASSTNFIDDNEEHTPWTQYEVVEEICQFMGWSLCPDGDDIYLVDYRAENAGATTYSKYDIQTGNYLGTYTSPSTPTPITLQLQAPGSATIEIDDIYNKIEISDNLYEIKDLTSDIFDDGMHISITDEKGLGVDGSKWTNTETKKFLWWTTSQTTTITGYDYQTICRLNPSSGWTHRFYRKSDLQELDNTNGTGYYDADSNSIYTVGKINKYCNTLGCLIQHYAHRKEEGKNNLPSSIDWTDILTFFIADDTTPNFNVLNVDKFELPVLEYTTGESIVWKPSSGTSWITIAGDLYYQWNGTKYGDKNRSTLNIVNKEAKFYSTSPVDKSVDIDECKYLGLYRNKNHSMYGLGFSMWKMKLQIGDKYWNGTNWTSTESTFYIKYNNNPDGDKDEYVSGYAWMDTVNNTNFKDKVGVDAYCIPIAATDGNAPVTGSLKLTIYVPSIIPPELLEVFRQWYSDSYIDVNWTNIPPVIYCKDFELGYVYTDTSVWWNNHDDDNTEDKVYIGYINDDYVKTKDDIEFKLNTSLPEKPISRSFVSTPTAYLKNMKHSTSGEYKVQEYNIVDLYLDHYSDRKVIYNQNVHGLFTPNSKFSKSQFDGVLMIDSQSYNFRDNNNTVKFIAY